MDHGNNANNYMGDVMRKKPIFIAVEHDGFEWEVFDVTIGSNFGSVTYDVDGNGLLFEDEVKSIKPISLNG